MVSALRSAWRGVTADAAALVERLRDGATAAPGGPEAGLHRYRFGADGDATQLHLRVQDDATGLLFVDVGEVLHLSPTATHLFWLALEKTPTAVALAQLGRCYRGVDGEVLGRDLQRARQIVDRLARPGPGCRFCGLELPRVPQYGVRARAPHKVDLALTYACENRCLHCYNQRGRQREPLTGEDWRRVLHRLAEIGVPHVILTGGEPTRHPDLLSIVEQATALGLVVGLNTNGRSLSRPRLAEQLARAGLDHVQVTLESHRADVHDAMVGAPAWRETVAGIRQALAAGLHTITNTTLTAANCDQIEETLALAHDLGVRTVAANSVIAAGRGRGHRSAIPVARLAPIAVRARDRARELELRFLWYAVTCYCELSPVELELSATRCNAGEYSMCVEPDGAVLPCQSYYQVAGNLLRDRWDDIWNSSLFRSFRERDRDARACGLPERCQGCPDFALCGGGCRLDRER
ncbi:MAG: radical SAM protein [Deltaproteobacteria bacterium]|nr:radical SAM protein [Deltaproteobacteria bacterium]